MPQPEQPPDLSFVVPAANENRWSDLLATLISTDPAPMKALLAIDFDTVRREVLLAVPGARRADRLDFLLQRGDRPAAVIEAKLLSDLGPGQLGRYLAAVPEAERHVVLHLARLPVSVGGSQPWTSLTWETVLDAYASSAHPWVRTTATAWLSSLDSLVPPVGPDTVWNDVPDDAAGLELALRARVAWLSSQVDLWCRLEHDMMQSSGGGNWALRLWADARTPGHLVTVELQEGLTAYGWKPDPQQPYRVRLPGPVVLLGLRQEPVTTSAGFDWSLLHQLFAAHVVDGEGRPRDDRAWQTTPARPTHPVDKEHWQAMVAAGAPRWLGKGWGMKVAASTGACLFGARYGLPATSTLSEIDAERRSIAGLVVQMAGEGA